MALAMAPAESLMPRALALSLHLPTVSEPTPLLRLHWIALEFKLESPILLACTSLVE